jgi:protease I
MTNGKRIAILATHGFEQSELVKPLETLRGAGFQVDVVSPEEGRIKGWKGKDWGDEVQVDVALSDASPGDYDALVLPGGVINPDKLRMDQAAVEFVRASTRPASRWPRSATALGCWPRRAWRRAGR